MTGIQSKIRLVGGQMRSEINRMLESIQDLYAFPTDTSIDETIKITTRKHLHLGSMMRRSLPTTVKSFPLTYTTHGTLVFPTSDLKFGGGWEMNSPSLDWVSYTDHTILNPTNKLTIAVWIYYNGVHQSTFVGKDSAWDIAGGVQGIVFEVWNGSGFTNLISYLPPIVNKWVHVVGTYGNAGVGSKLYINGSLYGSSTTYSGNLSSSAGTVDLLATTGLPDDLTLAKTRIAHLSILNATVDQTWVTNHYNGLLDTSGTNTEILTVPFVANELPYPDATSGMCRSG